MLRAKKELVTRNSRRRSREEETNFWLIRERKYRAPHSVASNATLVEAAVNGLASVADVGCVCVHIALFVASPTSYEALVRRPLAIRPALG